MSAKLNKTKNIKASFEPVDEYSPEQPGLINVAGEVFIINLPGVAQDDISSSLFDDSIKGDIAFQALYLGGLAKEDGGASQPFTQQEQTDLRRIFRAIFGPRQRILPTAAQMKSLGRKIIGKRGVAMPSKPSVFQLPCTDSDRDLMVKALEIRRQKLIEQIQNYDKLGLADIHARYLRDHLQRLNTLLDEEIATAKKTRRDCRYTGILDPNVPKPLPLNDARMERLLAIFAYLLAQGADPLAALSGRLPNPSTIIPMMAQADAPDIYNYEDAFVKEKPGKSPEYTRTILKIKKVLEGDAALDRAVDTTQLEAIIKETEAALFGTAVDRTGTLEDRKNRIRERLNRWDTEKKSAIAEITGLKNQLGEKEAALAKCLAEKGACDNELAALKSGADKAALEAKIKELTARLDILGKEKKDLETRLAALDGEVAKLRPQASMAEKLRLTNLELTRRLDDCETGRAKEKRDLESARDTAIRERDDALARLEAKQTELDAAITAADAARAEVEALRARPVADPAALAAAQAALATAQAEVERLTGELDDLGQENVAFQRQLDVANAEIARLRALPGPDANARAALQRDLDEATAEIARLRALPPPPAVAGEEEAARTAELDRRQRRITALEQETRDLQTSLNRALENTEVITAASQIARQEATRLRDANQALNTRMRQILDSINGLLRGQGLNIISADDEGEPDRVLTKIQSLQARLGAAAAAPVEDNRMILCLLNILYHLVKRTYILTGDQEGSDYRAAFQLIEQMAQPTRNAQLNQDVFRLFLLSLKTISGTELTEEEAEFFRDRLSSLSLAVLQSDANAAIVYPLGKRLLKIFYPARIISEENSFIGLPVIYVLALTKKVLLQNQAAIEAAGCVLPVGLMGSPAAAAAPPSGRPSGEPSRIGAPAPIEDEENNASIIGLPGGISRTSTVESNESEEESSSAARVGGICREKTLVNKATIGSDMASLTTAEAKKLSSFPFCLDPQGGAWKDISKKDLKRKAKANLLANLGPAGTPEFREAIKPYASLTFQINGSTGDITIPRLSGGGAKTRKLTKSKSNKAKTYKKSK